MALGQCGRILCVSWASGRGSGRDGAAVDGGNSGVRSGQSGRGDAARYANALVGLAAGDAWGYQVEFVHYDRMRVRPVPRPAGEWVVSDDTQMTLAVDRALADSPDLGDIDAVTAALTASFIAWRRDPDNDRAPGTACMAAVRNLGGGARWHEPNGATDSAGCGAVNTPSWRCPRTWSPPHGLIHILRPATGHTMPEEIKID